MDAHNPKLSLNFITESDPQEHLVDAEMLAKALVHGQRAIHILALTAAGRTIRERLRVPVQIAKEFRLVCKPPLPGSYAQPVTLVGSGEQLDLPSRTGVLDKFAEIGAVLSRESWRELQELVPDSLARERLLDEYISLLPSPDSGVGFDLLQNGKRYATFRQPQLRSIAEYRRSYRQSEIGAEAASIVGNLIRIDFAANEFALRQYRTRRRINCEYSDEVEESLLQHRHGLIQVTGILELDGRDQPLRMTSVYEVSEVDLTPIEIQEVAGTHLKLRFRQGPYTFTPSLGEDGAFFVVEDDELDIYAYATTRSELISELEAQIEFLWLEYADTSDELTVGAESLGQRLRHYLEPVEDA